MTDNQQNDFIVHVFNVGHGDSIVLEFPFKKKYGIIDYNSFGKDSVLEFFINRLSISNDFVIEFICLTHYHLDHFNGFGSLIEFFKDNRIEINEFWDPGISLKKFNTWKELYKNHGSPLRLKYIRELSKIFQLFQNNYPDIDYHAINGYKTDYRIIENVKIDVISPFHNHWHEYNKGLYEKERYDSNFEHLICVGLLVRYKNCNIVLASDIPEKSWMKIINNNYLDVKIDIAKVSHHGSNQGNESRILAQIYSNKTTLIISGGYRSNIKIESLFNKSLDDGNNLYCTGDFLKNKLQKYEEEDKNLNIYKFELNIQSTIVFEGKYELHGNIHIIVNKNGKSHIIPENNLPSLIEKKEILHNYLRISNNYNFYSN